jgi:hypothetical protein
MLIAPKSDVEKMASIVEGYGTDILVIPYMGHFRIYGYEEFEFIIAAYYDKGHYHIHYTNISTGENFHQQLQIMESKLPPDWYKRFLTENEMKLITELRKKIPKIVKKVTTE